MKKKQNPKQQSKLTDTQSSKEALKKDSNENKKLPDTKKKAGPVKFKQDTKTSKLLPREENYEVLVKQIAETTGIRDIDAASHLLNQVMNGQYNHSSSSTKANAAMAFLHGIAPRDTLEGLLAAQMTVTHELTMEFASRAIAKDQSVDAVNNNVNRITKLMRTFNAQIETLIRYRNQGQQTIQVQHVNVNAGGQAMVGNISNQPPTAKPGGGQEL